VWRYEVERLIVRRRNYVYPWSFQVSEPPISAADVPTLRTFISKGRETGRISYVYDTAKNVLNKLNLIKGSKLLNAGRALFCKDNGIEARAAVFATNEKTTFLDIQLFKGTLFDIINQCETYIKEHINWRADITGFKRVEIPEVPINAVREAIVNSLCHRDFGNPGGNEIAIYKSRIEIFNPGQFPYDFSPDDFIRGEERSIPRNPPIADIFYLTRDIEKWGSGLKRISDECRASGIKVEFKKIKSGFVVVFHRPAVKGGLLGARSEEKTAGKRVGRLGVKLGERLGVKLGENETKILNLVLANKFATISFIAESIGISTTAVEKNLSKLKAKGVLRRVGSDRSGQWEVLK
jgi:ATP-dependent DNA helicase RecG